MNISKISSKSFLGKILRFPLKFIPPNTEMPILQGKIKGIKWIVGSSIHGCWLGSYEYEKRILFENAVKSNKTIYDVGAHVGFYTLLASVLTGSRGKVFAFEPVPRNFYYLKRHVQINNIENVDIFNVAVSDKCGTALFAENDNSSMGHISSHGKLKIETVSLDDLYKAGKITAPDYIKLDVEGTEHSVLRGAKVILTKFQPIIFLSIHNEKAHRKCYEFLKNLGYSLETIGESDDEILAIKKLRDINK